MVLGSPAAWADRAGASGPTSAATAITTTTTTIGMDAKGEGLATGCRSMADTSWPLGSRRSAPAVERGRGVLPVTRCCVTGHNSATQPPGKGGYAAIGEIVKRPL